MKIVLLITTIIFAISYARQRLNVLTLAYFIVESGQKEPDESDLDRCMRAVLKEIFNLNKQ